MRKLLALLLTLYTTTTSGQSRNIVIDSFTDFNNSNFMNAPNEPTIAISPKNPSLLLAGANINNYYYSTDTGRTWVTKKINSSLGVWGDPVTIADTTGGFYYFHISYDSSIRTWPDFCTQIVCQHASTGTLDTCNDGAGIGRAAYPNMEDKPWGAVDFRNNKVYLSWTRFDKYGSHLSRDSSNIYFSSSADGGSTWSSPLRINSEAGDCVDDDNTVEGAVPCVGPHGEVYVAWAGHDKIVFNRSFDGGNTWLPHDTMVTGMPGSWAYDIPGINRCDGLPFIACDNSSGPHKGSIYVNWSDQRNGINNTDVWLTRSTDSGNTWSAPLRVNTDTGSTHQFMSAMTIDQYNGNLYILYYDRRDTTGDTLKTNVYLAVSRDGGTSFHDYRINERSFIPNGAIFFGDYCGVTAANRIVRPIWGEVDFGPVYATERIVTALIAPSITVDIPEAPVLTRAEGSLHIYPNPVREAASIVYTLPAAGPVSIFITDMEGKKVATLTDNEPMNSGAHQLTLNQNNLQLASGIYLLTLRSPFYSATVKLVIK